MFNSEIINWTLINDNEDNRKILDLIKLIFLNTDESSELAINLMESGLNYKKDIGINMDGFAQQSYNNLFFYSILSTNLKIIKYLIENTDDNFTDITRKFDFYIFDKENKSTFLSVILTYFDINIFINYIENESITTIISDEPKIVSDDVIAITLFQDYNQELFSKVYRYAISKNLGEDILTYIKYKETIYIQKLKLKNKENFLKKIKENL